MYKNIGHKYFCPRFLGSLSTLLRSLTQFFLRLRLLLIQQQIIQQILEKKIVHLLFTFFYYYRKQTRKCLCFYKGTYTQKYTQPPYTHYAI